MDSFPASWIQGVPDPFNTRFLPCCDHEVIQATLCAGRQYEKRPARRDLLDGHLQPRCFTPPSFYSKPEES